jgi:uncharacterized membrane protein
MSPTYISAIVLLLTELTKVFNLNVGSEKITSIVQAVIILVTGSIILIRRFKKGDITLAGTKIK